VVPQFSSSHARSDFAQLQIVGATRWFRPPAERLLENSFTSDAQQGSLCTSVRLPAIGPSSLFAAIVL
jgi:hypothetical protein